MNYKDVIETYNFLSELFEVKTDKIRFHSLKVEPNYFELLATYNKIDIEIIYYLKGQNVCVLGRITPEEDRKIKDLINYHLSQWDNRNEETNEG